MLTGNWDSAEEASIRVAEYRELGLCGGGINQSRGVKLPSDELGVLNDWNQFAPVPLPLHARAGLQNAQLF